LAILSAAARIGEGERRKFDPVREQRDPGRANLDTWRALRPTRLRVLSRPAGAENTFSLLRIFLSLLCGGDGFSTGNSAQVAKIHDACDFIC
jgi:hypothetical protein